MKNERWIPVAFLAFIWGMLQLLTGAIDGGPRFCTLSKDKWTGTDCCAPTGKWGYVLPLKEPACRFIVWMGEP